MFFLHLLIILNIVCVYISLSRNPTFLAVSFILCWFPGYITTQITNTSQTTISLTDTVTMVTPSLMTAPQDATMNCKFVFTNILFRKNLKSKL